NDQLKEFSFGDDISLRESVALGLINPKDFENLKLNSSLNLKLSNQNGQVIIKVKQDENVPIGTLLMPVSIWANQITGISNNQLIFKNIGVNAEVTREAVLNLKDLLHIIKK
ncbi:MAG TPA: hypothetical protein ENI29_05610, partial [bacterium]|nr:hypothetical protein [bacterium]